MEIFRAVNGKDVIYVWGEEVPNNGPSGIQWQAECPARSCHIKGASLTHAERSMLEYLKVNRATFHVAHHKKPDGTFTHRQGTNQLAIGINPKYLAMPIEVGIPKMG